MILNLKKFFGLESKVELLTDIKKSAGKGAGKSLSMTRKFNENGADVYGRIKLSNSEDSKRKIVGLDPNIGDAIGEAFASTISFALSKKSAPGYPAAPHVSYFADGQGGVGLVSRYIEGIAGNTEVGDFDQVRNEMLKKSNCTKQPSRHAVMTVSDQEGLNIDTNNPSILKIGGDLKREMYSEIVTRMILGDHDNNPGNSIIFKDQSGKQHVAGIDYGHAFNDLIKNWSFGRDHQPGGGGLLDAINRPRVNGGESKFRRDYRGVIPDPDFAIALREIGSSSKIDAIRSAITEAAEDVKKLKQEHGVSENELRESMKTLCSRVGAPIKDAENLSFDAITTHLQNNLALFVENNTAEAKSVANLIDIQTEVDKALKSGKPLNIKSLKMLFEDDEKYLKGKDFNSKMVWPRTDDDKTPKECSLVQYMESRAKQLNIEKNSITLTNIHALKAEASQAMKSKNNINIPPAPNAVVKIQTRNRSNSILTSIQSKTLKIHPPLTLQVSDTKDVIKNSPSAKSDKELDESSGVNSSKKNGAKIKISVKSMIDKFEQKVSASSLSSTNLDSRVIAKQKSPANLSR